MWVDLVFLFVYKVDSHAHVKVYVNLVHLVKLHTWELILACSLIGVQAVVEQLRFHWHIRVHVAELESRMETVWVLLLKLLVPFRGTRWPALMVLLDWPRRGSGLWRALVRYILSLHLLTIFTLDRVGALVDWAITTPFFLLVVHFLWCAGLALCLLACADLVS